MQTVEAGNQSARRAIIALRIQRKQHQRLYGICIKQFGDHVGLETSEAQGCRIQIFESTLIFRTENAL